MTRISCLTVTACLALVVTAIGCNDGSGIAPDGSFTGQGGASAQGGTTGTGGTTGAAGRGSGGVTGTGGGAAAGATGAAGAKGTGGVAGTTGAAGTKGVAGTTGSAGTTGAAGAAGAKGAAGAGGAAGAAGAKGAAGAGGGGFICQANATCTAGQECQLACSGGASSQSTFCSCTDQGGGGLTLACVSLACGGRDAAVNDAGPIVGACATGLKDGDNCNLNVDTLCQSVCAANTQMHCLCAPHGGGGGGKWACTAGIACH
jgi:pilus assembly protein FimV